MSLKSLLLLCLPIFAASFASAAEWPQPSVDNALSIVKKAEQGMAECVQNAHAKIAYSVTQKDINGDGVNEIEVASGVEQLGTGAIACFGGAGQDIYLLISDGKGGWQTEFGYDAASLGYHSRGKGLFPDVEITGPGFCFPIWRYFNGQYAIWKTCDGENKLVFAYTVKGLTDVVPESRAETRPDNDAVVAPVVDASSDWSGEYGLDCKSKKFQCTATLRDIPGGNVLGEFVVADFMDINKVKCSVTGLFYKTGSSLKADTKAGSISLSQGSGGIKVAGISANACPVSLDGTYVVFGDE